MIRTNRHLYDVFQTGREMARLVRSYWSDLGPWLGASFWAYYTHVCKLPYVDDPEDVETVSRPIYTLNPAYRPRDCDDKAVLMACWFHGRGIRCRFVASSTRPDKQVHHVFLQVDGVGFVDATYNYYCKMIGNYDYFPYITELVALTEWF